MDERDGSRPPGGSSPRRIERALAETPAPAARAAFREALRRGFVTGSRSAVGPPGSASQGSEGRRTGDAVQLERTLQGIPLAPAARGEFARELRAGFVRGSLEPSGLLPREAPRGPGDVGGRAGGPHLERVGGPPRWQLALGGLAAAAALVLLVVLRPERSDGPDGDDGIADRGARPVPEAPAPDRVRGAAPWTVTAPPGSRLEVDGEPVAPSSDPAAFRAALANASELRVEGGPMELHLDGALDLRLEPGTTLAIEELGWGSPSATSRLRLAAGELFIKTAPGYAGGDVEVHTPHTQVIVTGTRLSLAITEMGTCVCVAEGRVLVEPRCRDLLPTQVGCERTALVLYCEKTGRGNFLARSLAELEVEHPEHVAHLREFR